MVLILKEQVQKSSHNHIISVLILAEKGKWRSKRQLSLGS